MNVLLDHTLNRKTITKKDLVKIFTHVPPEFLDDFYDFIDGQSKHPITLFVVNIDHVAKWLNIRKDNLLSTLRRSYKKNEDFKESMNEKSMKRHGGQNKINVFISIDCFKRLAMRSTSAKAETVRSYFIEIDNFMTKYTKQIANGIIRDIEVTSTNMQTLEDKPGYIYIVESDETMPNHVKVGMADDIIKRLQAYNVGRPRDIKLIYAASTPRKLEVERCVKSVLQLKRYIKKREVFHLDAETVRKVIDGCNALSTVLHHKQYKKELKGKYYVIFMDEDIFSK